MATSPKNDVPPQGKARPKSRSPPTSPPPPPIEYRYMYEDNKSPTKQLDAILRAIARYVVCEIGDKNVGQLTPKKLAAFYKAVGGDYDSLFVQTDHPSISYIWTVTGCQHTLQPTEDDFKPPSIPALTPRGFSRWESLEILLGPEEHVPFIQFAVKNWKLRHPDTSQEFPPDLPRSVFPAVADEDVDAWHRHCANELKKEASREREAAAHSGPEHDYPEPKTGTHFAYTHVRKPPFQPSRARPPEGAYFERDRGSVPFSHVPGRHPSARMPPRPSPEGHHPDSRFEEQARRRSFSDYNTPPPPRPDPTSYPRGAPYLDPNATKRPDPSPRRQSQHSNPRHTSSDSSDEEPIPPRTSRRHDDSPPCVPRYEHSAPQRSPPPAYRHRPDLRPEEERRRSVPSPTFREKFSEKLSSVLPNGFGPERPRNPRGPGSYTDARPRRPRDLPPSRLSRSYSDLDSEATSESEDDVPPRRRMRDDRDPKDRDRRGHPKDFDRDDDRRERQHLRRPEVGRRTSSHADMDRRRDYPTWDPRRDDRKRWEKRVPHDDREASPMAGRRFAEESYA